MNATSIFKFLHVLAAVIWVGGGFMLQVLLWRAKKTSVDAVGHFSSAAEWTSKHVFIPAAFAALVFGIITVIVGGYDWGAPWIAVGFVGFVASALIGTTILGPTAKKMVALTAERGPNDPVVAHMARRIDLFGRIDLIILVVVVFFMVVKP